MLLTQECNTTVPRRWRQQNSFFVSSTKIKETMKCIKATINSLRPQLHSLLKLWMCFSEGLAVHSETHSFLLPPPLACLRLSELKSKIMTENPTACCLATYTRKPHYIRSHEGHVHAHTHPQTIIWGFYASPKPNSAWLKNRNTSHSVVSSIFTRVKFKCNIQGLMRARTFSYWTSHTTLFPNCILAEWPLLFKAKLL